jgi:choline dehydrogenase-like flavoprotein
MITTGLLGLNDSSQDICIIGAGPVGISLALELASRGRSVVLLESGDIHASEDAQRLSDAEIFNSQVHVPMDIAVERSLGGTSNLWGGRCVPFEPIDFERRPGIAHSGWPISMADISPYLPQACNYIGCGASNFDNKLPNFRPADSSFLFERIERWSKQPRFRIMYRQTLQDSHRINVRTRATVSGLEFATDGKVSAVQLHGPGNTRASLRARAIVLAAGGLESTRLLLAARQTDQNRFGGDEGPLGRYYMGHLYGIAANIELNAADVDAGIDYFRDIDGFYVRRRFTPSMELQRRMNLTNVSLWPDYPLLRDPAHRSGVLSLAYLALSIPPVGRIIVAESIRQHYVGGVTKRLPHILNVLRDLRRTTGFLPSFLYRRYLSSHRMPGFFQRNIARQYALRFHAEHLPNPDSRVILSEKRDAYGLPRLAVDLRYSLADADPLIRSHDCFAEWLEQTGIGTMKWLVPREERSHYILSQCYDGHHQIGTTRMSENPRTGVVDKDCRVFGSPNLFVAGSSVFPTSGEANPTLTSVALAIRLAEHLAGEAPGMVP